MKEATLYEKSGMAGSYNLDLEIDDPNYDRVMNAETEDSVQVEATVVRGNTGNQGQVFIKKDYEEFFLDGISLIDVEVIQVVGKPGTNPQIGTLHPQGTKIVLQGTRADR
jgi:hypothetical protein